ncbi:tRNA (adenosine(37)-N6)-threonylcarbamoyltransferase complex transferase subunit TsaD [Candidatus Saccharibacteria bacterium]|nr:tRNA (adenosine(37)-N6)-threonylcarbamoyltransferase complex transferase subunit TsaD [Candidatus Saccharibacteria bacterium]
MNILAIETSCDETAAAVVQDGSKVLSSVVNSQVEIHAAYGGVVPEVAARSHIEVILPVIEQALSDAKATWDDIDAIAVTRGPGLIGSLLIGVLTAKTLAFAKNKPLIGVNHIWAHAFAAFLTPTPPAFPFLALTVSGGHTTLSLYREDLTREVLGQTLDDAAGEAFDKVAKLIGLPYPGGPHISKAAENGDENKYKFPIAKTPGKYDFSFSGLKTAVLRQVQEITGVNPGNSRSVILNSSEESQRSFGRPQDDNKGKLTKTYTLDKQVQADIAASFQKAAVQALVQKTLSVYTVTQPASMVVGGGVAANKYLRTKLTQSLPNALFLPFELCTDNAAMIGAMAAKMAEHKRYSSIDELTADSSLEEL